MFRLVVFRKGERKLLLHTRLTIQQALLETIDHGTRTENDIHTFTLATFEGLSIDETLKIDVHLITIPAGPVHFHVFHLLLPQLFHHVVQIFIGHGSNGLFDGNP